MGADGQRFQVQPTGVDIFGKHARIQGNGAGGAHGVHTLLGQEADLPVPVSGMGVTHDAVVQLQLDLRNGMLLGSFLFADIDGYDRGQGTHSFIL